ncbi:hypothetical protein BESB_014300 [Besnoitia besnoiti]|uniref:ABC1 atypical kinase-like domain-containing protein n=1 Tax=Besnoitia besnoiti TaxID=94643 RepID=A0A2A9MB14_BESBE|nr:hypothetical protein BESB_014300 [Besnoitia besnoiti]PFH32817.1 hypothetical protein BESB_014300 [Besnoitia besnoiti]
MSYLRGVGSMEPAQIIPEGCSTVFTFVQADAYTLKMLCARWWSTAVATHVTGSQCHGAVLQRGHETSSVPYFHTLLCHAVASLWLYYVGIFCGNWKRTKASAERQSVSFCTRDASWAGSLALAVALACPSTDKEKGKEGAGLMDPTHSAEVPYSSSACPSCPADSSSTASPASAPPSSASSVSSRASSSLWRQLVASSSACRSFEKALGEQLDELCRFASSLPGALSESAAALLAWKAARDAGVEEEFAGVWATIGRQPESIERFLRSSFYLILAAIDYKLTFRRLEKVDARLNTLEQERSRAQRDFQVVAERQRRATPAHAADGGQAREKDATLLGGASGAPSDFAVAQLGIWEERLRELERGIAALRERRTGLLAGVHDRCAARLLHVCLRHGGLYTKLGQYMSTMNHILPSAYTDRLRTLQDDAERTPWPLVSRLLEAELGRPVEEVFLSFDRDAVAAASLAHVHRARLRCNGQEVAVKVQRPRLREQMRGDLQTLETLMAFVSRFFPDFEFRWVLPEFRQNMRQETDFEQEAYNAMRLKWLYRDRPEVYIPWIDWDLTTKRVLTMEFVSGLKVTDSPDTLQRELGAKPEEIADLVMTVFADMLFVHGFVHCDPHPGNLFVRLMPTEENAKKTRHAESPRGGAPPSCVSAAWTSSPSAPTTSPSSAAAPAEAFEERENRRYTQGGKGEQPRKGRLQLVIIDHGTYRRLSPSFRAAYCRLWKALLLNDVATGRQACRSLGLRLTVTGLSEPGSDLAARGEKGSRPAAERQPSRQADAVAQGAREGSGADPTGEWGDQRGGHVRGKDGEEREDEMDETREPGGGLAGRSAARRREVGGQRGSAPEDSARAASRHLFARDVPDPDEDAALDLLSLILTYRPQTRLLYTALGSVVHAEDRKAFITSLRGTSFSAISAFLESLPRDLLWILRMTNILRSLNHTLGGSTRSRLLVMGESSCRGLQLGNAGVEALEAECARFLAGRREAARRPKGVAQRGGRAGRRHAPVDPNEPRSDAALAKKEERGEGGEGKARDASEKAPQERDCIHDEGFMIPEPRQTRELRTSSLTEEPAKETRKAKADKEEEPCAGWGSHTDPGGAQTREELFQRRGLEMPHWYTLPGATSLNLPVASDVPAFGASATITSLCRALDAVTSPLAWLAAALGRGAESREEAEERGREGLPARQEENGRATRPRRQGERVERGGQSAPLVEREKGRQGDRVSLGALLLEASAAACEDPMKGLELRIFAFHDKDIPREDTLDEVRISSGAAPASLGFAHSSSFAVLSSSEASHSASLSLSPWAAWLQRALLNAVLSFQLWWSVQCLRFRLWVADALLALAIAQPAVGDALDEPRERGGAFRRFSG